MRPRKTPPRGWLQLAAALPIIAGIAHILTTFVAANDLRTSSYARLAATLKPNEMKVIDEIAPGHQPLPFLSSDARYAMCLFSTRASPVRASAVLPDFGWSLGVYRPDGSSAYFAAASEGRSTSIQLTIVPDDDRFLGMTPQALGQSIDVNPQLTVAAKDGVVVVRAPDAGPAERGVADRFLAKAGCAPAAY